MKFTLLYSPDVEEARAFISEFDGKGQILTTPEECVAFGVGFAGYPTVVYEDSEGGFHAKFRPTSWQEVQSWADFVELQLKAPKPSQVEFTRTEFKRLFTLEELNTLIMANEASLFDTPIGEEREMLLDVKRMWNLLSDSEFISMKDPLTVNSLYLLVLDGYLTKARFDEIKKGVFKI